MKIDITEKTLFKLTSNLLMDFCQFVMRDDGIVLEHMTIDDINDYCKGWMEHNVRFEKDDKD